VSFVRRAGACVDATSAALSPRAACASLGDEALAREHADQFVKAVLAVRARSAAGSLDEPGADEVAE
jgi:hypothetical protein